MYYKVYMNTNRRKKMINICRLKIDKKGRITLPKTMLDANNIKEGGYVIIRAMQTSNSVKLLFETNKGVTNESNKRTVQEI